MFIGDLNKHDVLAALYNAAKPLGMGFAQYDPTPWSRETAEAAFGDGYFDYVKGRVMKIDLETDNVDTRGYNRDNGNGMAEYVIDRFRTTGQVDDREITDHHSAATLDAAMDARHRMEHDVSGPLGDGIFNLGLTDVADFLAPFVDEAEEANKK